jgi:hypothetical protein
LHHYLWGILTVSAVGGLAVRGGEELRRQQPALAIAFGAGLPRSSTSSPFCWT